MGSWVKRANFFRAMLVGQGREGHLVPCCAKLHLASPMGDALLESPA